jgi:hypothetical protein
MVYPTFTVNTKAINIASKVGYQPHFDIVWSFEYAISGNSSTEAGFTLFLMDNIPLSGGNNGIDLGFSGLSSITGGPGTIQPGISGAIIGVGFDTTGLFAASAYSGVQIIRDGIAATSCTPNSIIIRSEWPGYSFNTYSYNQPITSIDSDFKIVESSVKYKTIRARLGNVGKKLYVDYRYNVEDNFKPLLEYDVDLNITSATKYKAGISFATPISSNLNSAIGNVYIRNFHTEGSSVSGKLTTSTTPGIVDCITLLPKISALPPDIYPVPKIPDIIVPSIGTDNICTSLSIVASRLSSYSANVGATEDLYNFGYTVYLSSTVFTGVLLSRTGVFSYGPSQGYTLYKSNVCSNWSLSSPTFEYSNNSLYPIGTYNTTITATYI